MASLHILLATLCMTFTHQSLAQVPSDDWIIQIFDPPENVTFPCSSPIQTPPNGSVPNKWMFPDLTNVDLDYNDGHRIVTNGGENLMIIDADVEDFGIYHCMMLYPVNEIEEWYLVKVGLNVKGPYFEDLWQKYKTPTIIGFSACIGFLAIALLIWIVASHSWVAPDDWYEEDDTKGTDNNAFDANMESLTDLNIHYVPSPDRTDTNLHHRNREPTVSNTYTNITPHSHEAQMSNGEAKTAANDMVTEL